MSPERIELITPVLGMDPFILVEFRPDPDSEAGFDLKIQAGGGPSTNDEIASMLLFVVERLTGVEPDLYVEQIDAMRRAAGLPTLSSATDGSAGSR